MVKDCILDSLTPNRDLLKPAVNNIHITGVHVHYSKLLPLAVIKSHIIQELNIKNIGSALITFFDKYKTAVQDSAVSLGKYSKGKPWH